jgi:hypothetical protein
VIVMRGFLVIVMHRVGCSNYCEVMHLRASESCCAVPASNRICNTGPGLRPRDRRRVIDAPLRLLRDGGANARIRRQWAATELTYARSCVHTRTGVQVESRVKLTASPGPSVQ